jgi:hypothetical protein
MCKYSDVGSDDKRTKAVSIFVHEVITLVLVFKKKYTGSIIVASMHTHFDLNP